MLRVYQSMSQTLLTNITRSSIDGIRTTEHTFIVKFKNGETAHIRRGEGDETLNVILENTSDCDGKKLNENYILLSLKIKGR